MSKDAFSKRIKELTPEQYHVTQEKGTERPYTGEYDKFFKDGIYKCVVCGTQLFDSSSKFNSGCGWPAFYQASGSKGKDDSSNLVRTEDESLGMKRVEVTCKKCDAHLGHVFEDGPAPTGLRYCINSASLEFDSKK